MRVVVGGLLCASTRSARANGGDALAQLGAWGRPPIPASPVPRRRLLGAPRSCRVAVARRRSGPGRGRRLAAVRNGVDPARRRADPCRRAAPGPARWVPLRGAVAVAAPTALAAAHASLYGRWEVDDAGITFAYARSVATGAGPVLQLGAPPVEGFSDPTWLALLAFGRMLGLFDHGTWFGVPDYVAYPKTLAILLLAVVFSAFLAAGRRCRGTPPPSPRSPGAPAR